MTMNIFKGRSFLKEADFTPDEFYTLIKLAEYFKELKEKHIQHDYLAGKNIALLFEKTSTRTRSSFTVGAQDLGANAEFLGAHDIQFGKKESLADTAKVLGSMFDGIEYRGFEQKNVEDLALYSKVPVWNGLTNDWHPTQMLADFMTIDELFDHIKGIKLAYLGDARNNVARSLLLAGSMLGAEIHLVGPKSLQPGAEVINLASQYSDNFLISDDLDKAVDGVDVLYTDVWASMGEEDLWESRIKLLQPYQLNAKTVAKTHNPNTVVLHDLPAFHDLNTTMGQEIFKKFGLKEMEITDEVFNAPYAHQFQQAANRMHTIKAVMAATLGDLFIPRALEL
ncbi:ornithine carbamoyltransferase [Oenococcus sp.]|uniref:ornithine carbamoyltransferase n=1 Tax=Oenococcus sp. TaxID=1979414 RepID=UPI0039EA6C99